MVQKIGNFLDSSKLSDKNVKVMEATMSKHYLTFSKLKDKEVENYKFDPFVYTFYKMVEEVGWIPWQNKFIERYIKDHPETVEKFYDKMDAVRARIGRCHPSYARDLHFAMKCRESGLFEEVIYNTDIDVCEGIDLLIKKHNRWWGIHCFVQTERGVEFRGKKDNRHPNRSIEAEHIDFTVFRKDSKHVGNYYLFTDDHVKKLSELIDSKAGL